MIWSDLYNDIQPHVPGCPEPAIEDAVRRTAMRFCRDSHIWEEELQSVYLANGVDRYQVELPEETAVLSLVSAIQRKSADETGKEVWPSINVFGLLHFSPLPDPDQGPVEIRAVLKPSRDATGLPDRIGLDYDEALVHGAIAALQEIPGRDWSNPNMVSYHKTIYFDGVAEAIGRRARGNTDRPLRVKAHPNL
jgi:hypothetical protein